MGLPRSRVDKDVVDPGTRLVFVEEFFVAACHHQRLPHGNTKYVPAGR